MIRRHIDITRMLSIVLSILVITAALPLNIFAAEAEEDKPTSGAGNYHYVAAEDGGEPSYYSDDTFIWSDKWFFTDGRIYNSHLAALSAVACSASAGYSGVSAGRDNNIRNFLSEMRFEDIETNAYYRVENLEDSAGCAIAHKTVSSGNKSATLIALFPMSADYRREWAGNFNVGADGLHAGFKAARDELLRFMRQYIEDKNITGEIKLWTAGHSRGAAAANLLGAFFALGGDSYFGGEITISPENILDYTFAAPSVTPSAGVTKAQILSVDGGREDYPDDTTGDEYAYTGDDGANEVDPRSTDFSCIHNCRPGYDLITLLPPDGWGFTVFGSEFDITDGSAKTKTRMESWLKKADSALYNSYKTRGELMGIPTRSDGDADNYAWKRFNFKSLIFVDDGKLSMSDMMAARVNGLTALCGEREIYAEEYQDVAKAVFGMVGMDNGYLGKLTEDDSIIETVIFNYIAYVCERMDADETAASAELLNGLYDQIMGEDVRFESMDCNEAVTKLAGLLSYSPLIMLMLPNYLPDDVRTAVCKGAGMDENRYGVAFNEIISQVLSTEPETAEIGRSKLYKAVEYYFEGQDADGLLSAIGKNDDGSYNGTGAFSGAIEAFFDMLLVDSDGNSMTLEQRADALLSSLAESFKTKTLEKMREEGRSDIACQAMEDYCSTLEAEPYKLRGLLFYFISATDLDRPFSASKELRTVMTFMTQLNKVTYAHHNGVYTAWMRALDSVYLLDGDLLGDADNSGKVNIMDATAIQRHLAALQPLSESGLRLADVSGNYDVTIEDATIIQRYLAGLQSLSNS